MAAGKEVEEDLERRNEENLRLGLALSCDEAHCFGLSIASPEVPMGPTPGGPSPRELVSSLIPVGDVDGNSPSPNPALGPATPETLRWEDTGADASKVKTFVPRCEGSSSGGEAPVRCGVLAFIFRVTSSCPSNEEIFCLLFDIEARAMKILGDLVPVESWPIRENHILSCTSTLDEEGQGVGEQMLREYLLDVWKELLELEERICLVDRCTSREEYHYHVLGTCSLFPLDRPHTQDRFGVSRIMEEEEEHRKIYRCGEAPRGGSSEASTSGGPEARCPPFFLEGAYGGMRAYRGSMHQCSGYIKKEAGGRGGVVLCQRYG